MSEGFRFRASACRQFIVGFIGQAAPHVLSLAQAEALALEYKNKGDAAERAGNKAVAAYEYASGTALRNALEEALPF